MRFMDPCAGGMDLVHETVNPVYTFFFRKIIPKIWKNTGPCLFT
jgi:hypothetical protein